MPVEPQTLLIRAGETERQYWRDLWNYRELFYFLAWRDILVRYKQTIIGIAWSLLRPLIALVVLTVIFGKVAKLSSGGVPYPILVCAGLLPWQFFANALTDSSNSLISNANLVSKVYFPRLIVPLSSVVTALADFCISLAILAGLMVWYQYIPSARVVFVPLFLALAIIAATGAGVWLAALTVRYRDFRFIVPLIVQFGVFLSPLGYRLEEVPAEWRLLYSANPMVGVINGFRWALLDSGVELHGYSVLMSALVAGALLAIGVWHFRRTERTFADTI
ncbi:MAG TPA: ABC transporter permease [Methylomirabilota bacterium]|nr:ABC transporter permease [Methylomirabilota bacterium]